MHHQKHSTIRKTRELVARKYYGDLQLLLIPIYRRKGTSYDLILVIIGLHDEPVQISRCTQAARDNFRCSNSIPLSPRLSIQGSVFTFKFWFSRYHSMHLL